MPTRDIGDPIAALDLADQLPPEFSVTPHAPSLAPARPAAQASIPVRLLADGIRGELDVLRARAARAADQADRDTAAKRALARADADALIPYDEHFPADWDLIVTHAGEHYLAADLHCPKPSCSCRDVVVTFNRLGDDEDACFVGDARIDLGPSKPRVTPSSRAIGGIVEQLHSTLDC